MPPALSFRMCTITQFVADFFGNHASDVDYSDFDDAPCWNGYVAMVAEYGGLLEDVVQAAIRAGEEVAEWYDILEEATEAFRNELISQKGQPRADHLRKEFESAVRRHLEKPSSLNLE